MSEEVIQEKEKEVNPKDAALLKEALKAYGIAEKYVHGSRVDVEGKVTIVTHGGKKVAWKKGMEVEPLTTIQVTGIDPDRQKRKPLTGR